MPSVSRRLVLSSVASLMATDDRVNSSWIEGL